MKLVSILLLGLLTSSFAMAAGDADALAQTSIQVKAANVDDVLSKTLGNVKSIFERYEVKVDQGSTITSPLQVGGTETNPTLKVTIKKCVLIVCQEVALDGEVSVRQTNGACASNFMMTVDLTRSSATLANVYDRLNVAICVNKTADGAKADLTASAHHAPSYQPGTIQNEIFKLLKLQVDPIVAALKATLKANGAQ